MRFQRSLARISAFLAASAADALDATGSDADAFSWTASGALEIVGVPAAGPDVPLTVLADCAHAIPMGTKQHETDKMPNPVAFVNSTINAPRKDEGKFLYALRHGLGIRFGWSCYVVYEFAHSTFVLDIRSDTKELIVSTYLIDTTTPSDVPLHDLTGVDWVSLDLPNGESVVKHMRISSG
jgi:hypothetical protein